MTLERAIDRLRRQIGTLELVGGAKFQPIADELSAPVGDIEKLKDALAQWAAESAALLNESSASRARETGA